MSDIFLSYASEDLQRVEVLVRALERHGWSVWWDRSILPGRTFDQAIEEALDAARCVIVVWSQHSVHSDWVKTEAAEGARRRILVPVLLDEVRIPLEFRRMQAARLLDWQDPGPHPEFDKVVRAVEETLDDTDALLPGAVVYVVATYRDQRVNQSTRLRVLAPDGSVFDSWNFDLSEGGLGEPYYAATYWYWTLPLPAGP